MEYDGIFMGFNFLPYLTINNRIFTGFNEDLINVDG